jgi:hypothetical protein
MFDILEAVMSSCKNFVKKQESFMKKLLFLMLYIFCSVAILPSSDYEKFLRDLKKKEEEHILVLEAIETLRNFGERFPARTSSSSVVLKAQQQEKQKQSSCSIS